MNIGCDIESVEIFREHWKKKKHSFFERIFSKAEIEYCQKFKDPAPHFAARFSAKEAVIKAATPIRLVISDVQIQNNSSGAPVAKIWKKRSVAEKFFKDSEVMVSLSHTNDMAMACVLIQKKNA